MQATTKFDLLVSVGDWTHVLQYVSRPFCAAGNHPKLHSSGGIIMKLTPGKLAGLQRVSDKRGVIAAAAMDQRGSPPKSLEKEKSGALSDRMMEEIKSLVTGVLTPPATAILLD